MLNLDHGYVGTVARWEWVPGALAAVRLATERGWLVFVVTNQSGVARGFYDEAAVQALHGWMAEQVRHAGGLVHDVRYCPHHPQAPLPRYRQDCRCRKPKPGMILDLLDARGLDAGRCLMVGDQPTDMVAAAAAGVAGCLFPGGNLLDFLAPLLDANIQNAPCGDGDGGT